jgi:hypothetical protein
MSTVLFDYYKTPISPTRLSAQDQGANHPGFFRFGPDIVCYGDCSNGVSTDVATSAALDARIATTVSPSSIQMPFDVSAVIDNLRRERYLWQLTPQRKGVAQNEAIRKMYYFVRKLLPVWYRRHLQRAYFKGWESIPFPHWPVDFTVDSLHEALLLLAMRAQERDKVPFIWFWPEGAGSCLVLTHDVETAAGRDFSPSLIQIDSSHGFKASFQVIPEERYEVPDSYLQEIRGPGFEINVHDLNHDGHLFREKDEFLRRAKKINEYGKKFGARGFRAGAMYRNQDWFDALEFSYDMSVPSVAHLEPQRGGCCTVMPYFVGNILEIPLTATQDYTMFHILNDYSIDLWKEQIKLVQERNGLISFIAHPDYLIDRKARKTYESLLAYLDEVAQRDNVWRALPGEVDQWWRARNQMKLVSNGDGWRIEGPGKERARIAFASIEDDQIAYTIT